MALDSLEASLAASQTVQPTTHTVRNDPPRVIVSYGPAVLVPIEGKPVIKPMPDSRFERVINTQAMIARTRFDSTWYLHLYDGWVSSASLEGPWTRASRAPFGLDDAAKALAKSGTVDLLDGGPGATPKPMLANGVPAVYVTETPTELILFKGQPNLVPITGTPLLWASNSVTDVIVDTGNNNYYVLMAGRWFRAPGLNGPWTYVASNALPASFKQIPAKGSPASVVLASVAGTAQAQEAVIANSIPQTAAVSRADGPKFTPVFDGIPQWQPVGGTPLQYVVNSKVPVIEVNPSSYYAVAGGVWFTSGALTGPWVIATTVPGVMYSIPVSSPLHYVTYVHVYGYTDSAVYVGYTPGYLGTVVDVGGTVVYGTGYAYTPWIGNVWYAAPVTWGVAAAPVYNPYVGFTFGFALGMTAAYWAAPYWGGAYYHAGYYGYPCCGSASANVYRSWPGGVSSGTRTYWADNGGAFGTTAAGSYSTYRGTSRHLQRPTQLESVHRTGGRGLQPHVQYGRPERPARSIAMRPTTPKRASAPTDRTCRRPAPAEARSIATFQRRRVRRVSAATRRRRRTTPTPAKPRRGTTACRRTRMLRVRTATSIAATLAATGSSIRQADGAPRRATPGRVPSSRRATPVPIAPAAGAAADGIDRAAANSVAIAGAAGSAAALGGFGGGSGSWGNRFSGGSMGDRFGGGGFRGGGFRR